MRKPHIHINHLVRCLALLSGILLYSIFSADKSGPEIHSPERAQYSVEYNLSDGFEIEDENTSENSGQTNTIFDLVLKETPKQKQITVSSHNSSILHQGNNSPKPDSKDVYTDQSLLYKSLMLLPEEVRSGLAFRLTIHLFSNFLSLPGDIAINAP